MRRAVVAAFLLLLWSPHSLGQSTTCLELFGAGSTAINGLWCPQQLTTNATTPQYEHRYKHQMFEMFLFNTSFQGSWWNIQEVLQDDNGEMEYGQVYYGAQGTPADVIPPSQLTIYPERWVGVPPGPQVRVAPATPDDPTRRRERERERLMQYVDSYRDYQLAAEDNCAPDDEACFDYYVNLYDYQDLQSTPPAKDRMCANRGEFVNPLPANELSSLQHAWNNSHIAVIPNFLDVTFAQELVGILKRNRLHPTFWHASFWDVALNTAKVIPMRTENNVSISHWLTFQRSRRSLGKYAYSFSRSVPTLPARLRLFYKFAFQDVIEFLGSPAVLNTLRNITGNDYELHTYFFSRYSSGDFLDLHSDSVGVRKIAFVYQLSEDWKITNGGLLHFVSPDDWTTVERVIKPTFNTFMFFDVSQERRILPHFVSEVVAGLDKSRYSITGWYQYKGDMEPMKLEPQRGYIEIC